MSTHIKRNTTNRIYFITFTCYDWLPLIEKSETYNYCYKWFDYLSKNRCKIAGYVIMPNHFHGIFYLEENCIATINQVISNGKRFWAYEIIKGLKRKKENDLLNYLQRNLPENKVKIGSQHNVFKISFDCKNCFNRDMVKVKLDYMHQNPIKGKWNITEDYRNYSYSSAKFYELNIDNEHITHYMEII